MSETHDDEMARRAREAMAADPEAFARQTAGVILYMAARQFVEAGLRPGNSVRLAAAVLIEEAMGPQALRDLRVPDPTMYRWRAEAKAALTAKGTDEMPDVPPAELVDRVARLLAGMPVQRD